MKLLSSLIFIFFGYIMLFFNGYSIGNLVVYLLSLIIFSVKIVFPDKKIIRSLSILFLLTPFLDIKNIAFIPLIVYSYKNIDQYKYKLLTYVLIVCFYYMFNYIFLDKYIFIICILFTVVASFMNYSFEKNEEMKKKIQRMRDDRVEYEKLLKEKNKTLIENQDYAIYTATLKERNRIAREIHDNIGHSLSRAILMVGAMKSVIKNETLKDSVGVLDDTLKKAMTDVRNSVHDLHDDSFNLRDEILKLIGDFDFCEVDLKYDANYELPNDIKYNFITVIKESLVNVVKHSDANLVSITIREHPSMYQLIIADDGKKIDENIGNNSSYSQGNEGIGMKNMQERIRNMGGNLIISTENGFKIHIVVPKKE